MSSRPILPPNTNTPIINAMTMAADITGPATIIQMLPGLSYDISWTGAPVGTFEVQVSNTYRQNADGSVASLGNWTTIPVASFSGTYPIPAGSASNGFLDVVGTECYAVRLHYTRTSGTGALTVVACGKVL